MSQQEYVLSADEEELRRLAVQHSAWRAAAHELWGGTISVLHHPPNSKERYCS